MLGGFLLGSGIQVARLKEATTPQALVDGFVGALHLWALVGGGLVVAVIALGAALVRLSSAAAADMTAASATTGAAREGSPSWSEAGPEREWRPEPRPEPGPGPGPEKTTAPPVVVPPPAPSPEDDPGNGPVHR